MAYTPVNSLELRRGEVNEVEEELKEEKSLTQVSADECIFEIICISDIVTLMRINFLCLFLAGLENLSSAFEW